MTTLKSFRPNNIKIYRNKNNSSLHRKDGATQRGPSPPNFEKTISSIYNIGYTHVSETPHLIIIRKVSGYYNIIMLISNTFRPFRLSVLWRWQGVQGSYPDMDKASLKGPHKKILDKKPNKGVLPMVLDHDEACNSKGQECTSQFSSMSMQG